MNGSERLVAYLEGGLPDGERLALEARLLQDEQLAAQLYEEIGTSRLLGAGAQVRRRRRPPRRALAWAVPFVAAAVLLLLLLPSGEPGPVAPVLRGQPGGIVLFAPAPGPVALPLEFRWSAREGAARYTLELFDGEGRRVLSKSTPDTLYRAGAGELPPTGGTGFWWVEAFDRDARPLGRSEAREISVAPPPEGED